MKKLLASLITAVSIQATAGEVRTVDNVDIDRFMGAWYVIGHIPTFITDQAYNAVEQYRRDEENTVEVLFTYRDGGFDGEHKDMTPTGFVDEDEPAEWGMRLVWPFKADYRIAYLDDEYHTTIIARNKRDYVWIMSRTPEISDEQYQHLLDETAAMGYDVSQIRKVPQQSLSDRPPLSPMGE